MNDLTGQTLGQYRIVEPIGRGGMASVYKAYQPSLDRYVAIKVLPPYYAHEPGFAMRFTREAKAVAKLDHPNILPIYDFGQEGDLSYIVMKYVAAGTLKEMMGQPMPPAQAADIISQIAAAVVKAHNQGVIHRDGYPSNVLMDRGQWALLMDFGLAKMVAGSVQLTASGVGVGTPAYMAPEQGQGETVDARVDVYSLGVVLYEMLTGRVPFDAETPMAVVLKHIIEPLPMPRTVNPAIPEPVERVILKAMAKDPADRYASTGEMAAALQRAIAQAETLPQAALPPAEAILAPQATPPATEQPIAPAEEEKPAAIRTRRKLPRWAFALGAVALVALVGVILVATGIISSDETPTPTLLAQTKRSDEETVTVAAPTPTSPTALEPVSPGIPPARVRDVRPCDWEGLGPGLCIWSPPDDRPIKLLEDAGLEFTAPPSWSPNGEQIALCAMDPGGARQHETAVYIVNSDGSNLHPLPQLGNDISPAWSPNGEWLAFHSNCDLAIMHPDGSGATVIWPHDERCTMAPQWSPDSEWIVFSLTPAEEWRFPMTREVWVISRDGAIITPVASISHPSQECFQDTVAFSLDGGQVAYFDADCRPMIVNADGRGQAMPLTDFPYWWTSSVYPQWGGAALSGTSRMCHDSRAEPTPDPAPQLRYPAILSANRTCENRRLCALSPGDQPRACSATGQVSPG